MSEEQVIWLGEKGYTYIVETSKVKYRVVNVTKISHNLLENSITFFGDVQSLTFKKSDIIIWWREHELNT